MMMRKKLRFSISALWENKNMRLYCADKQYIEEFLRRGVNRCIGLRLGLYRASDPTPPQLVDISDCFSSLAFVLCSNCCLRTKQTIIVLSSRLQARRHGVQLPARSSVCVPRVSCANQTTSHRCHIAATSPIRHPTAPNRTTPPAQHMADGLFCAAGPSVWNSLPDNLRDPIIGGNSFSLWRRFCSQRTDASRTLQVSRRCAI